MRYQRDEAIRFGFSLVGIAVAVLLLFSWWLGASHNCDVRCSPREHRLIEGECYCVLYDGTLQIPE